jgi:formate C-acetyltransferase
VFEKEIVSMKDLLNALDSNFHEYDIIQQKIINKTPKYGNDDDYADSLTREVFEMVYNAIDNRPNTRGGVHRINLLPTTVHVYFGQVTGATPDGRNAYTPLSEGISPVQGMDVNGPTAVIKSAAKIDHLRTGGTLLNQKFTPLFFSDQNRIKQLANLIRTYFKMNGHHMQFNVISVETLRAAQISPEKFRNLIVRVAGYSDYFNKLVPDLQEEIIRRTEHTLI